jgi:hypothetical protein
MPSRMGPGAGMPSRGSQWRAIVKGLPISASWQDLKVHSLLQSRGAHGGKGVLLGCCQSDAPAAALHCKCTVTSG